ncbi:metallophosphoesterase [bacterium]|nr:metallophosphoesterase [bacterium]
MKILFTSDIHLETAHPERFDALKEICRIAVEKKCKRIIIGGDLFDDPSEAKGIGQTIGDEIFDKYDIDIDIIPGNHDMDAFKKGTYFGKRVNIYREHGFLDIDNCRIHYIPFRDESSYFTKMLLEISKNTGEKNIAVFHANLTNLFYAGEEKQYEYMDCELSDFAGSGIDLILAGHIHSGFKKLGYDGGHFCYAGSPVSVTTKEIGPRSVILLDTGDLSLHELQLENTFHFTGIEIEVFLDEATALKDIEARLNAVKDNCSVLLHINGLFKTDENIFREKVDAIVEKVKFSVNISYSTQFVGDVESHPIYKRFKDLVDNGNFSSADRALMIREFLSAAGGIL